MKKTFVTRLIILIGLLLLVFAIADINPHVGLVVGLIFLIVPSIAIFKSIPSIWLDHKGFNLCIVLFVGLLGTTYSLDEIKLEKLRVTNPEAYLVEIENNRDLWLRELKELAPERWEIEQKRIAEEQAVKAAEETKKREAATRVKAERAKAKAEREAAKAAEEAKERQAKAAEEAEKRRNGFHCLSEWDGSHREFKWAVKERMREPDSFKHVETGVTPVSENGMHRIYMKYRARNGFGGMNVGMATGMYRNDNCSFSLKFPPVFGRIQRSFRLVSTRMLPDCKQKKLRYIR